MKLYSKEALLAGGLYEASIFPFRYVKSDWAENVSFILTCFFIVCLVMLFFNKTPAFISNFFKKAPDTAYYIVSFGWLPYFDILVLVAFFITGIIADPSEQTIIKVIDIYAFITNFGIIFSLLIAFLRARLRKESK